MVPSKEGPNHISQDLLSCVYMCLTKKKRIVGLLGRALSMPLFVQQISPLRRAVHLSSQSPLLSEIANIV